MIGRAFTLNYTCGMVNAEGKSTYELLFGKDPNSELDIPGELVLFMPLLTIIGHKVAKRESNLRAGIFLDYYVGPDGLFTGQCLCVCMEDFAGKNPHTRVDRQHFQLKLHRAEVLKRPAGAARPYFPFQNEVLSVQLHY